MRTSLVCVTSVNYLLRLRFVDVFMIVSIIINIYSFIVECDATRFCCENGTSGCEGRCMSLGVVEDGKPDCDNGSDEKVTLAEGI